MIQRDVDAANFTCRMMIVSNHNNQPRVTVEDEKDCVAVTRSPGLVCKLVSTRLAYINLRIKTTYFQLIKK